MFEDPYEGMAPDEYMKVNLLRRPLWGRWYAVKVRGFAQNYSNAKLDMHFSLSEDLTTVHDFRQIYKTGGMPALISRLSRGDV